jgi:type I restriction enzyme S subunit
MSTETTHIEPDNQILPALRFNEFDEDWSSFALKDITPIDEKYGIVDGPFGSNLKTIHYKEEGVPIITSGYVTNGYFYAKKYLFVTPEKFLKEKRSAVRAGDIVMAKIGARCGASAILPKKHETSILSGNALKITVDETRFSTMVIWQQLYHLYTTHKIDLLKTVGAQPAISIANLKKFKVVVPNLPEQQKIASFLSAVDEKIQQLTKKKSLLEQYKKGVMQQLFSGQLRFKDENGNPYPDWEEKKLGDVGKIKMCKRIFSDQTTEIGDIPFYKIGTFGKEADAYITNELFIEFKEKYSYPKVGEILMSASGTLGRTVVYDGSEAYFQDSNIVWIENNEDLITNEFLFYVYQVVRYQSEGGTIQRLYNSIISAAKFLKPSLVEQHKVTNLLSRIDTKIGALNNQITQTQTFKKGLLQQMFV